jgi:hypothetical protein
VKKRQHYSFEAAPPSHDLTAADLIVGKPLIGGKPVHNLSAASLTSGAPECTTPALTQTTPPKLKPAGRQAVFTALWEEYTTGGKPNVNQVVAPVQHRLEKRGLKASKRLIQEIASNPEFNQQRHPVGSHRTKVVPTK